MLLSSWPTSVLNSVDIVNRRGQHQLPLASRQNRLPSREKSYRATVAAVGASTLSFTWQILPKLDASRRLACA